MAGPASSRAVGCSAGLPTAVAAGPGWPAVVQAGSVAGSVVDSVAGSMAGSMAAVAGPRRAAVAAVVLAPREVVVTAEDRE